MAYRGDVNGLRAVAVLSVLAFHANVHGFNGGYAGVDVFFVISGFLIAKLIFKQVDEGRFSIRTFYARRVRRIAPALLGMILLTTVAALVLLYPAEIMDFVRSGAAAIFSLSNIYFWSSTSYFDAPAMAKPLLHTWSLGVEEQYYLLFPLLILGMRRLRPGTRAAVLGAVLVGSLGVSTWLVWTDSTGAFYLPQSRVWEFLVGAFLACGLIPAHTSRWSREAVAGIGLAAILLAVFWFNSSTPFPGLAALLPCLGTAAVIQAGSGGPTLTSRLLSFPPVAAIGTISYSLYLYHWPFIVFQRLDGVVDVGPSTSVNRIILVVLMFAVSFLSWKYVETPFRTGRAPFRTRLAWLAGVPAAAIVAAGLCVMATGGLPQRFSKESTRLANFLAYDPASDMRLGSCFLDNKMPFSDFDKAACLQRLDGKPVILLFGDSHAGHLYPGFKAVYGHEANILEATATGCKPLVRDISGSSTCDQMVRYVFDTYLPTHHVDFLVVSARWAQEDVRFIAATLDVLDRQGIRTVLVGPTPEYDVQLPGLLARNGTASQIASHLDPAFGKLDRELEQIVGTRRFVTYYSAYQALCDLKACASISNGDPLFYDKGHLTRSGSMLLVGNMQKVIRVL